VEVRSRGRKDGLVLGGQGGNQAKEKMEDKKEEKGGGKGKRRRKKKYRQGKRKWGDGHRNSAGGGRKEVKKKGHAKTILREVVSEEQSRWCRKGTGGTLKAERKGVWEGMGGNRRGGRINREGVGYTMGMKRGKKG